MGNIKKRIEEGEVDALGLSRLDLISCALGGAVLLAIVFSLVKHEQNPSSASTKFILVVWECKNLKISDKGLFSEKFNAAVEITQPNGDVFVCDLIRNEQIWRQEKPTMQAEKKPTGGQANIPRSNSSQLISLHIARPKPGKWKFAVKYSQLNEGGMDLLEFDVAQTVILPSNMKKYPLITKINGNGNETVRVFAEETID